MKSPKTVEIPIHIETKKPLTKKGITQIIEKIYKTTNCIKLEELYICAGTGIEAVVICKK
ncbi:MAG: hypothetical protein WCJ58_03770 [bacterium]